MKRFTRMMAFAAIAALATTGSAFAQDINTRLGTSLDDDGTLRISNGYLSNYILRGVDPATGEAGSFRLLQRNRRALDLSKVIEWDGFFPSAGKFEFASEQTVVDLSTYPFPNGVDWRNSEVVFRGANLLGLATDPPQTKGELTEAVALFLLNGVTASEIVAEVASGSDRVLDTAILEKVQTLADFIVNAKDNLVLAQDLFATVDIIGRQAARIQEASTISFDAYSEIQGGIDYIDAFLDGLVEIGVTIPVSEEVRAARTGMIADQYDKLLQRATDNLSDEEIFDAVVEEYVERLSAASTEDESVRLAIEYAINPIGDVLVLLENDQKRTLERLIAAKAPESEIADARRALRITQSGFLAVQFTRLLADPDEVLRIARDEPELIVSVLFEAGSAAAKELITIDNTEIVAKQLVQRFARLDGRTSKFETIRKVSDNANAYMAALQLGSNIGNRLIPFIWDVVLGENTLRTSIVDGQIDPYGRPESLIAVTRQSSDQQNRRFEYTNTSGTLEHVVKADRGDRLNIGASLYRPGLFDPGRAPWELNKNQIPTGLYTVGIVTDDAQTETALCVRRILGNTDFAIHSRRSATQSAQLTDCGEGTLRAADVFQDVPGERLFIPDPNTLPEKYRLSTSLDTPPAPITTQTYDVHGREGETFTVQYRNLAGAQFLHRFTIEPASSSIGIQLDTSQLTPNDLTIQANLTGLGDITDADVASMVWDWGDGSTSEQSGLGAAAHTYSQTGVYNVTVDVDLANGGRLEGARDVDVLSGPPQQPPGTPLAVPGDGFVTLNWNGIEGAVSYNVYSATESFGEPPDFENYASFANGRLDPGITDISFTVGNLENGVRHYFVVTGVDAMGNEQIVSVVGIAPGFQREQKVGQPYLITVRDEVCPPIEEQSFPIGVAPCGGAGSVAISDDGRTILFTDLSINLVDDHPTSQEGYQLFKWSEDDDAVRRVDLGLNSRGDANSVSDIGLVLSGNGNVAAFQSSNRFTLDGTDATYSTLVYEFGTSSLSVVDDHDSGRYVGGSLPFGLSEDGITLSANAESGRYGGPADGSRSVVAFDLSTGTAEYIGQTNDQSSIEMAESSLVTPDKRYSLLYTDKALTADDTNGRVDLYRREIDSGEVLRISTHKVYPPAPDLWRTDAISHDGATIAFIMESTELDDRGLPAARPFIWRQDKPGLVEIPFQDVEANAAFLDLSGDGRKVVYTELNRKGRGGYFGNVYSYLIE